MLCSKCNTVVADKLQLATATCLVEEKKIISNVNR